MFFQAHVVFQAHVLHAHVVADIMSVFGKIATGSLAGTAAGIHIRVDPLAARIPRKAPKNEPFQPSWS
jgi:hypothetical protein